MARVIQSLQELDFLLKLILCPLQKVPFIEERNNCPVPALIFHTSLNKTRAWWFYLSGSPWWSPFWNTARLSQYGKFNVDLESSDRLQLRGRFALRSLWKSLHKLIEKLRLLFSFHEKRTNRKHLQYNNCAPEKYRGSICRPKGAGYLSNYPEDLIKEITKLDHWDSKCTHPKAFSVLAN